MSDIEANDFANPDPRPPHPMMPKTRRPSAEAADWPGLAEAATATPDVTALVVCKNFRRFNVDIDFLL